MDEVSLDSQESENKNSEESFLSEDSLELDDVKSVGMQKIYSTMENVNQNIINKLKIEAEMEETTHNQKNMRNQKRNRRNGTVTSRKEGSHKALSKA